MPILDDSIIHVDKDDTHVYFNPVSGGYIATDDVGSRLIDSMGETDDEDAVIEELAGHLAIDDLSAAAKYVSFAEKLKRRGLFEKPVRPADDIPIPFYGFIEVTRRCPSMCRICAIDTGRGSEDVLTLDEIRHVIDQFNDMGIKFAALTGGDPLLRPEIIEILRYIRDKDMAAGFSTSLLTLTEDVARRLAELNVKIQVSLDGSTPAVNDFNRGEGSFEKAMKGIELLHKYGVEFRIAFCIMKHNIDDIPNMVELAERLGAKEVAFRKIKLLGRAVRLKDEVYPSPHDMTRAYSHLYRTAYGRDPESMRINAKYNDVVFKGRGPEFNRLPCGAGRNIIHITHKGDIVPCSLFTEDKFIQGNVRKDDIAGVWKDSELLSFFRNTRVEDIPKCRGCRYRYLCGGGCRAEAYFLDGNFMGECCDCDDLLAFYDYLLGTSAERLEKVTVQ
jgi:radical SAM protein with 4Fe4S-binding SPASM domain